MILYFSYKEQLSRTFDSFYTLTINFSLLQRVQFSLEIHEIVENNYFFIVFTPYPQCMLAQKILNCSYCAIKILNIADKIVC